MSQDQAWSAQTADPRARSTSFSAIVVLGMVTVLWAAGGEESSRREALDPDAVAVAQVRHGVLEAGHPLLDSLGGQAAGVPARPPAGSMAGPPGEALAETPAADAAPDETPDHTAVSAAEVRIEVRKSERRLRVLHRGRLVFTCRVSLGANPAGHKVREGDGRTPEGDYRVATLHDGRWGDCLLIDYPRPEDARTGQARGLVDADTVAAIESAHRAGRLPPQDTALGSWIGIHGGGLRDGDWTGGGIAVEPHDLERILRWAGPGSAVHVEP